MTEYAKKPRTTAISTLWQVDIMSTWQDTRASELSSDPQNKTQSEDSPNGTKQKWGCGKFSTRQNEILLSIPKQSGKRTDLETSSNRSEEVMTKAETVEQMGYRK